MDQQPIEIRIEYQTNSNETGEVDLLSRDYFDGDLVEAGAPLEVDSEPLYYDTADYLDIPAADLRWVKLSLRNRESERMLAFHTSYWNGGKNQITAKTEWSEGVIVEEAITLSLATGDSPAVSHVIRTVSEEGVLRPVYHRVFTTTDTGEAEETIL